MFEITIVSKNDVHSLLKVNKLDYVDVILKGSQVYLITNTEEAFAMLKMGARVSAKQGNVEFRIHSKILESLDDEDTVDFIITQDDVIAEVKNLHGAIRYSCKLHKQVVPTVVYEDKFNIANNLPESIVVDSDGLEGLYRIAKLNGGLINVNNGIASLIMQNGVRVYKKVKTNLSFALTSKAYEFLRVCSTGFQSISNLLVAARSNFVVAVRKARLETASEYELLAGDKFGSKYIAEINVGSIFSFVAKMGYKMDSITLKLEDSKCDLEQFNSVFSVPFSIAGEQIANGYHPEDVVLPTKMFSSILNFIGSNTFLLKVKMNYVQFQYQDYIIVV